MRAEILATGDEIRSGALVDSNSAYIAGELESIGLEVFRHTSIGDDTEVIADVLKEIGNRSDFAVVTGGLGPTTDDLTTEAAAKAAGVGQFLDEASLKEIENFFRSRKFPMGDSNRKQAMFPEGATVMKNPVGTAPGFFIRIGKCLFFCLPGVPVEMRRMMQDAVLPEIRSRMGNPGVRIVKTLSIFGLPESIVGERVANVTKSFPSIRLGLRAKFPEIQVKLYMAGERKDRVIEELEAASAWVREKIGDKIFSDQGNSMEVEIGKLLLEKGKTLALAESCTGGLISHTITNAPGSSDYFLFSAVTYSNRAKMDILGVSPETIETHGAVSENTAREMASGARRVSGADYGLSVTGIAGPSGGTPEKPVGTVCFGVDNGSSILTRKYSYPYLGRDRNKAVFAMKALDLLRRNLLYDGSDH